MHILITVLVCFFAGMGAGLGTGFAGMSAAAVISPMLITFLGMDPYLAVGIANLVNILRPEAVVLGGGIACEGEGLFVPLRKAVEEQIYVCADEVPLKIVGAKLGNDAGMYGAYAQAKENC